MNICFFTFFCMFKENGGTRGRLIWLSICLHSGHDIRVLVLSGFSWVVLILLAPAKVPLKNVGGVSWGSLVIHLSENHYFRGLLLMASLSLGHSHPIMIRLYYLAWETKFSNTNNEKNFLLSGPNASISTILLFFLMMLVFMSCISK